MDNYPPPPGFNTPPPRYAEQQATVIQSEPTVNIVITPIFGPNSTSLQCPSCHAMVSSKIVKTASGKTHLIALGLCIFQCWLCIPCVYCMDTCRTMNHYCPNCDAYLGEYSSI